MNTLLNRVNQTQAAISSLQQNKEEVISSVEEITSMTRHVSDSIEQVAATTEEQNASMEQMAVVAEALSDQAQDLQNTLNDLRFNWIVRIALKKYKSIHHM